MTHPWNPRRALKESYSKHTSTVLIIKMSRAEQRIKDEIRLKQVKVWSKEEIARVYG